MTAQGRVSTRFTVERDDTQVMFMRAKEATAAAIQQAWAELETAVGLKGRKFFGTFDKQTGEYRVCAQLREGDDPDALGFEVATFSEGPISVHGCRASRPASMRRSQLPLRNW